MSLPQSLPDSFTEVLAKIDRKQEGVWEFSFKEEWLAIEQLKLELEIRLKGRRDYRFLFIPALSVAYIIMGESCLHSILPGLLQHGGLAFTEHLAEVGPLDLVTTGTGTAAHSTYGVNKHCPDLAIRDRNYGARPVWILEVAASQSFRAAKEKVIVDLLCGEMTTLSACVVNFDLTKVNGVREISRVTIHVYRWYLSGPFNGMDGTLVWGEMDKEKMIRYFKVGDDDAEFFIAVREDLQLSKSLTWDELQNEQLLPRYYNIECRDMVKRCTTTNCRAPVLQLDLRMLARHLRTAVELDNTKCEVKSVHVVETDFDLAWRMV